MRATFITSVCACLTLISAAPVAQHYRQQHTHHKRVDWNAISYDFSGVDWDTVSYDLGNVDWATVFTTTATAPAPTAAPAAAPSPAETEQVTINRDQVQAIPNTPATTTTAMTSAATTTTGDVTSAVAGNIVYYQTSTTSSAAAATTAVVTNTYSNTNTGSGKRGLGWDPASPVSSASKFVGSEVSWYFDWSTSAISGAPSGWQFYANIWNAQGIENLASTLSGAPKLIGFNEPDSVTQSNIGVSEAISLYQQYLAPLKSSGVISELGTPAVTNSQNSGEGLSYLSSFVNGCTNCNLDFAVVHWYAEDLDDFKNHVTQAHTLTGLPVNVAEFAYTSWNSANEPSTDAVLSFMTQAVEWLDAQSFVQAYAWFGAQYLTESKFPALGASNSLIDEGLDSLTALGQAYCN